MKRGNKIKGIMKGKDRRMSQDKNQKCKGKFEINSRLVSKVKEGIERMAKRKARGEVKTEKGK